MKGLADAFNKYMDSKDQKISFNELFDDLRKIDIKNNHPLLYEILERILNCEELQGEGNDRIDFDTFIRLIKQSLNMRKTKQQVKTIFRLFDESDSGFILMQNLAKINEDMHLGLSMEEIRRILLCCSSRGDRISFNEFYLIMTREDRNDFSGVPATSSNPTPHNQMLSIAQHDNINHLRPSMLSTRSNQITLEEGHMLNMRLSGEI